METTRLLTLQDTHRRTENVSWNERQDTEAILCFLWHAKTKSIRHIKSNTCMSLQWMVVCARVRGCVHVFYECVLSVKEGSERCRFLFSVSGDINLLQLLLKHKGNDWMHGWMRGWWKDEEEIKMIKDEAWGDQRKEEKIVTFQYPVAIKFNRKKDSTFRLYYKSMTRYPEPLQRMGIDANPGIF